MRDGATPRLSAGDHRSPRDGVCVVELASVIVEEEFSDHPRCVCPVIGAFLRGWNDRAQHAERQRLRPYAARIVDSRAGRRVTRERRRICLQWAGVDLDRGLLRRALAIVGARMRIAVFCGIRAALRPNEGAGDYAARVALARRDAEGAFDLLDALLATGRVPRPKPPPLPALVNGRVSPNGNGSSPNGSRPARSRSRVAAG